jgi:hypothetical protein
VTVVVIVFEPVEARTMNLDLDVPGLAAFAGLDSEVFLAFPLSEE